MRRYESVYIASTTIPEEELKGLTEKVEGIIARDNGLALKHIRWGKIRLAYNIQVHGTRHEQGHYFYLNYLASPETVVELERNFKIDERFLRYITVKLEDRPDIEALKARMAEEPEETRPRFEEPEPEAGAREEPPAEAQAPERGGESPDQEEKPAEEAPAEESGGEPEEEPGE